MASIVFYGVAIAVAIAVGVLRHQSLVSEAHRGARATDAPISAVESATARDGAAREAA